MNTDKPLNQYQSLTHHYLIYISTVLYLVLFYLAIWSNSVGMGMLIFGICDGLVDIIDRLSYLSMTAITSCQHNVLYILRLNGTALEMAETLHDLSQVRYGFGSHLLALLHALILTDTLTIHYATLRTTLHQCT